jgi:hypothetical protein
MGVFTFTYNSTIDQIIKNFILGGFIISSVCYLATKVNPVIAAIWLSFPISVFLSVYLIKQSGKNNKYISKFLLSTTITSLLLIMAIYLSYYYVKNIDNKSSILLPLIKATGCWVGACILFYIFVKYGGYSEYFL